MSFQEPEYNCNLCPRLNAYLQELRIKLPEGYNGPVPAFGDLNAQLLIVGLAPGARGANFTSRPFTGDGAGDTLYPQLIDSGFAKGAFGKHKDDGLELINCRITNAVRCVPPLNKPKGEEIKQCNLFLKDEISAMSSVKVILTLGRISHESVLKSFSLRQNAYKFAHLSTHIIDDETNNRSIKIVNSYHCSRYNMNTGRLTTLMFEDVFDLIKTYI